ncbi:MAG: glycosyltransferase [Pirellulales bacterium]
MNILMVTNTFTPHVGGVARSVASFSEEYRKLGHRVLTIAPEFDEPVPDEPDVIRVPAISHFNGSDFSFPLVLPGLLGSALEEFKPDIVHSHHPFLLGSTALRVGAMFAVPVVFTHHTRYETYTHYVTSSNSTFLKRFVVDLATGYCNLCDAVIAPSQSIADMLKQHGVETPVEVIPTGVDLDQFERGDGAAFRKASGIDEKAFVVGHVGRLAPEKNLGFLAQAVAAFLEQCPTACFLVVGRGPSEDEIRTVFQERGLTDRLFMPGTLEGQRLADAYSAMDVFAFSSKSETQGMVLVEAMAAGVPVVALDASGVRDVVVDGRNGRLLARESVDDFCAALRWIAGLSPGSRQQLEENVERTAERLSMPHCAERALNLYLRLVEQKHTPRELDDSPWSATLRWLEEEWKIVSNVAGAISHALTE